MQDVDKFVLLPTIKGIDRLDLRPYMVDEGLLINHSLEDGGWELIVTVADPLGIIRNHPILGRAKDDELPAVDVQLDGYWFRLLRVSRARDNTLTFTFLERAIDRIARKRKAIVTPRRKATRREFIVARVKSVGVRNIYSPSVHKKRKPLTPEEEQIRNERGPDAKLDASGGKDLGTFSSTAYGPPWDSDTAMQGDGVTADGTDLRSSQKVYGIAADPSVLSMGKHYFIWPNPFDHKGSFKVFDTGGAIKGKRLDFYDWRGRPHQLTWGRQNVRVSESPNFASTDSDASPLVAVAYQFKLGQREQGARENWWEGILRLSDDVRIRSFFDRGTFLCMSETELAQSRAVDTIRASNKEIAAVEWDFDNGDEEKRLTVELQCDRWAFPPGAAVVVEEEGRFNGRYIVVTKSGSAFDATATIELRRPLPELPEPAHEVKSVEDDETDDVTGDGSADALREIADRFSGPYEWGGGHGPPLSTLSVHEGLDCSSSTSLALYKAGMWDGPSYALVSGDFNQWGKPGKGKEFTVWYNDGHVWIEFADGNEFNTAGHSGVSGPRFGRFGYSTAGFSPRHWGSR